jgi:hypothetical protein
MSAPEGSVSKRLEVADLLDQHLDGYLLVVGYLVYLGLNTGPVHQDTGVRHQSGGGASHVLVYLEDLVDRLGLYKAAGYPLVDYQHHAFLVLQANRGRPPLDGFTGVFHLEQPSVRREDRNGPVVSHLSRLHVLSLSGVDWGSFLYSFAIG